MFVSRLNLTEAKVQAQANANYFRVPYVVFTDTSSNLRVERKANQKDPIWTAEPKDD